MNASGPFPGVLTPLGVAESMETGLAGTLGRLVDATGAAAGALLFRPPRSAAVVVTRAGRAAPARALRALVEAASERTPRVTPFARGVALRVPLGPPARPVGTLVLVGARRVLGAGTVPAGFRRELGAAIAQAWRRQRHVERIMAVGEVTRLLGAAQSRDDVLRAFLGVVARLLAFDGASLQLLDAERGQVDVLDVLARAMPGVVPGDARRPLAGTLLAQVQQRRGPVRLDDAEVPGGYRSAVVAPLDTPGGLFGAIVLASARPRAFDDADLEALADLARPLASALEQRRLVEETRHRADELATLYATSRLLTARLDLPSVLDRIGRSVAGLIGSTGCGIGLLDDSGTRLHHVAAHGFRSEEWRALALPVGEGIMGRCVETGVAIRVDDVRLDPRSARRDVDEREGIRSMLCVPLTVGGTPLGVISAFARHAAAFTADHQRVLEAFAEQAGIAIHNARLFEQLQSSARETRALFEAGRAVTASLDPDRTIQVILEQGRAVLGVHSCGLMMLDPVTRELTLRASLDVPRQMSGGVRIREGEGITGLAVLERRPVQSPDLSDDPRVRYAQLPLASGLRSMLAAPLSVGDRAVGAIVVFRRDVHRFTTAEVELLVALADQAAIALEHARLYGALEAMVAERTLELESQKGFVEVVLETLPLGVFVLDASLGVVRVNREGARLLAVDGAASPRLSALLPPEAAPAIETFLRGVLERRAVDAVEHELTVSGETKTVRLSAAPLDVAAGAARLVLLVEDVTRAKHLERQMLLTERLTTAGRLAAGVAHELNNPLATIAGCAESLQGRLKDSGLVDHPGLADFAHYLALIEEEAFRCKDITGSLLQLVREPGSRRAPTDLNALVQKTLELLSHQSRFAAATIVPRLDPTLPSVTVNEGQLRQVFLAIGANALEAMDGRGRLTVRTRRARADVVVEFEDAGPGIPPALAARIFDPFFTTKASGQGTGLGLAIAQGAVADHGGRIDVGPAPGGGSVFRVVLPA